MIAVHRSYLQIAFHEFDDATFKTVELQKMIYDGSFSLLEMSFLYCCR